jgi:hypothetical protein
MQVREKKEKMKKKSGGTKKETHGKILLPVLNTDVVAKHHLLLQFR